MFLGFKCNKINKVHIYILAKFSTGFDLRLHENTSPGRELGKHEVQIFQEM